MGQTTGSICFDKGIKIENNVYKLLTNINEEFVSIEENFENFSLEEAYHKIAELIHFLIYGILIAEKHLTREEIRALLPDAWRIHGYSSFGRHVQIWPRGYQGDFEAVNMIVDRIEKAPYGSLGWIIGHYALNSPIAQQHREKLKIQADFIKKICKEVSEPRILSLACGSSRDFEMVQDELKEAGAKILLVDFEADALKESLQRLAEIGSQIETLFVDIRRLRIFLRGLTEKDGKYHLIIAGGLFDYLSSSMIKMIIKGLFKHFLLEDGKFIFTNIASGNPYRAWMETMGNWKLIERSEEEIKELFADLNPEPEYKITREPTGFSWIVILTKVV